MSSVWQSALGTKSITAVNCRCTVTIIRIVIPRRYRHEKTGICLPLRCRDHTLGSIDETKDSSHALSSKSGSKTKGLCGFNFPEDWNTRRTNIGMSGTSDNPLFPPHQERSSPSLWTGLRGLFLSGASHIFLVHPWSDYTMNTSIASEPKLPKDFIWGFATGKLANGFCV